MRPLAAIKSFFAPPPVPAKRALEAAGGGWRLDPAASSPRPNADILAQGRQVKARARHAYQNNSHAASAVKSIAESAVGAGFTARSQHPDDEIRKNLSNDFEDWAISASFDGQSLGSLTLLIAISVIRDGEALVLFEADEGGALRLRAIDPDQLDTSLHRDLGDGRRIIAGVEMDARDRPVAYHIHPHALDLPFATIPQPVRIDAAKVLHVYRRDFVGQVRGLSWLTPVLASILDLDATADALLMKMKTEALIVAFLHDQTGEGSPPLPGQVEGDTLTSSLEPGTIIPLPSGKDVTPMSPTGTSAGAVDLVKMHQRAIATGIGATYEQITGDLSGVNYSSIRAGLIDFRRRIKTFQEHVLIQQLLRPIWRRWIEMEVLAGRTDAAAFAAEASSFHKVRFLPPGFEWVDPEKEIKADALAVSEGFKSRREVVSARGVDMDQLDAEIAEDGREATGPQEVAE